MIQDGCQYLFHTFFTGSSHQEGRFYGEEAYQHFPGAIVDKDFRVHWAKNRNCFVPYSREERFFALFASAMVRDSFCQSLPQGSDSRSQLLRKNLGRNPCLALAHGDALKEITSHLAIPWKALAFVDLD